MRFRTLACLGVAAVCVYVTAGAPWSPAPPRPALRKKNSIGNQRNVGLHDHTEPKSLQRTNLQNPENTSFNCDYRLGGLCFRCIDGFAGEGISIDYLLNGQCHCRDCSDENPNRFCNPSTDSECTTECPSAPDLNYPLLTGVFENFKCDNIRDCMDSPESPDEAQCSSQCDPSQDSDCYDCHNDQGSVTKDSLCNNVADCSDASDEYCFDPSNRGYKWCNDSVPECRFYVHYMQVCDGNVDAWNGEDEFFCFLCFDEPFMVDGDFMCDDYKDCRDGSDELSCGCDADEFTCANGNCIRENWQCDCWDDCGDGSDEIGCTCTSDEFICAKGCCIPEEWKCDNWDDCGDGSDEAVCCAADEFTCANGDCIPRHWQCDCWDDCRDGSDEIGCTCASDEFTCAPGCCIPEEWKCDTEADCFDGSDEAVCPGHGALAGSTCDWGEWGAWSGCNTGCGSGQRHRIRQCSCSSGHCNGEGVEYDMCNGDDCYPEANSSCGTRQPVQRNNRIVGGEDAVRGAWPWQAELFHGGSFTCGGTLVSNKYVISAAHCFKGPGYDYTTATHWKVQLGKLYAANSVDATKGELQSSVLQIHIHENYNEFTNDNDIAVMELSEPWPAIDEFVNVACLDTAGSKTFDASSNCFTTGFGALSSGGSLATILQEANVPLIPWGTCNAPSNYNDALTSNMLCAGFLEGGIDSCQGDSGGPLVCAAKDDDADVERWYLVGVTSWGYGCASANYPGVYTDVSQYIGWLQSKMP